VPQFLIRWLEEAGEAKIRRFTTLYCIPVDNSFDFWLGSWNNLVTKKISSFNSANFEVLFANTTYFPPGTWQIRNGTTEE
jgi:hypothetical protein